MIKCPVLLSIIIELKLLLIVQILDNIGGKYLYNSWNKNDNRFDRYLSLEDVTVAS